MTFRTEKYITRAMVRAEPQALFVFGDNIAEVGRAGQAKEMRGEPNAVGIPTKWFPSMSENAFFRDSDLPEVRGHIEAQFKLLAQHIVMMGGDVVWPEDGIGSGLAQLRERAPQIWAFIDMLRARVERAAQALDRGEK